MVEFWSDEVPEMGCTCSPVSTIYLQHISTGWSLTIAQFCSAIVHTTQCYACQTAEGVSIRWTEEGLPALELRGQKPQNFNAEFGRGCCNLTAAIEFGRSCSLSVVHLPEE